MRSYNLLRLVHGREYLPPAGFPEKLPEPGPPIPAGPPPAEYDPVDSACDARAEPYATPPAWFEGVPVTGTPEPPHVPSPMPDPSVSSMESEPPAPVDYSAGALDQATFDALMRGQGVGDVSAPADVVAQGHMAKPVPPQEQNHTEPDATAMMDAAFDSQMQAMFTEPEAQHPAQPDPAMHLEQVVEQEFNRLMNAGVPPDMQQPMGPGLM